MTDRPSLHVVASPIGNLDDVSPRARAALEAADLVVAEDTRRTRKLLSALGLGKRLESLPAAREAERVPRVLEALAAGQTVALVTDAGTPIVSDPGSILVREVRAAGYRVVPIAGPSAVTTALSAAGLGGGGFLFLGFLPRSGRARRAALAEVAASPRPVVLFEAPRRVGATLEDLGPHLGDRRIVLCRELTKLHEEIVEGTARDLADGWPDEPRGEVTLVVQGRSRSTDDDEVPDEVLRASVEEALAAGSPPSSAAREVARALGVPRARAYDIALGLRGDARASAPRDGDDPPDPDA